MQKQLILTVILLTVSGFLFSQNYELKVNVSSNFTFFSAFENRVEVIYEGLEIPGYINPNTSSRGPVIARDQASMSVMPGLSGDLELFYNVGDKWKYSSAVGIEQWNYSYDNTVGREDFPPLYLFSSPQVPERKKEIYDALGSETLSDLSGGYGQIQTLYLKVQPFNVSTNILQEKMFLQAGPVINFLLSNDHNDYAIEYNEGAEHTWDEIDNVYFSSVDKFHDVLPGIHFKTAYDMMKDLSVFISGEYFFHAPYSYVEDTEFVNKDQTGGYFETTKIHEKGPLPFQLQGGLQYSLWQFGGNNN